MMNQLQRPVDVLEHADRVGDHDVIERALDRGQRRRIFHVAQDKMKIGMQLPGPGNGPGAEIDADAVRRFERGEQFAATTAQFQHPLARRNQKSHEFPVVFAIGSIELAAAILFIETGFDVLLEFPFSQITGLQWESGWRQVHYGLNWTQNSYLWSSAPAF